MLNWLFKTLVALLTSSFANTCVTNSTFGSLNPIFSLEANALTAGDTTGMSHELNICFQLLVLYQFKHFIADFPLQLNYMVFRKTSPNWDFLWPLISHSAVHGAFTFAICLYYNPKLWWLSIVDLVLHFVADRLKSSPKYLGRFNDLSKPYYWWCFGLDQMIHHLTHIYIIYEIVRSISTTGGGGL